MKIFLPFIKSFLLIPLLVLDFQIMEAQNIIVPPANKAKASPIFFNATTSKDGGSIYDKNCVSCHGNPGKGNYLKALNPPPADLGTKNSQNQTDGELFYRISEGNPVMPKFKTTLSEDERWKLVSYIRSFNKTYAQPAPQKIAGKLLSKEVTIDINYDNINREVSLFVFALANKDTVPLIGSEALLFVNRYFGRLQIGNATKTNAKGIVTFTFPKDLPGDKDGNLVIVASINDSVYGEIIKNKKVKIGIPTNIPGLTEKRAMWNIESKAPIWLLITFFSIVTGVWLTIAYIILNIFKIKKLSSNINNK
jgi:cytochrome c553/ribosomal protein L35AE/L33A